MSRIGVLSLLIGFLVACGGRNTGFEEPVTSSNEPHLKPTNTITARAYLRPTEGNDVQGHVTFIDKGEVVEVRVELTGLSLGKHGFHIHEQGDCSAPDASSAGGHYAPHGNPHGGPEDEQRHVGDLGNIEADASGMVDTTFEDDVISLDGPVSVMGKAVIVHQGEDDFETQPTGAAGPRLACGVIDSQE